MEKLVPFASESIGELFGFAFWKELSFFPFCNIGAAALDEVASQAFAQAFSFIAGGLFERGEGRIEEGEQAMKGGFVAAMGCCGEQNDVTIARLREFLEEAIAQVSSSTGRGAGMGFVDDDERGADAEEVGASGVAFDVIEADDGIGVGEKNAIAGGKVAFEAACACGGDGDGANVESGFEFGDPLIDEVGWAEDGEAIISPRSINSRAMSAASMVLPTPTSSAMRRRMGSCLRAMRRGTS